MWDFFSIIIGFLIGLITMLLIVWILFASRAFVFSICPGTTPPCTMTDYFNDPGNALLDGAKVEDILFLPEQDLLYKRVPKEGGCTPLSSNQTIVIQYPQYCEFTSTDGHNYQSKNLSFGSPAYSFVNTAGTTIDVLTSRSCNPTRSTNSSVVSGHPLVKWDPNPTFTE